MVTSATVKAPRWSLPRTVALWAMWVGLWLGSAVLTRAGWLSAEGVAIVSAGGGIGAGLLVVLGHRQRWMIVTAGAAALMYLYVGQGLPWALTLGRTAADLASCIIWALVIRRYRDTGSGVGAPVHWAALAAVLAAAIRLLPVVAFALADGDSSSIYVSAAVVELGLGVVVGFIAFGSAVVGAWPLKDLRSDLTAPRSSVIIGTVAVGVATVVLYLTPLGGVINGSGFLVIPLLGLVAGWWSFRVTALVTAGTVLLIAVALSHGLGPFDGPAVAAEVTTTQVLLLALTVTTFSLAGAAEQSRRARRVAQASLAVQQALYQETPVPTVLVSDDDEMQMLDANEAFRTLLGPEHTASAGRPLHQCLGVSAAALAASFGPAADLRIRGSASGRTVWVRLARSEPLDDVDSAQPFRVVVLEDVTASLASEDLLLEQARRDPLTGLGNRNAFIDRMAEAAAANDPWAVVLVKVDGLRRVNSAAGPEVGDAVLVGAGSRLRSLAADAGEVFRVSSSEFGIVLITECTDDASTVAKQAHAQLAEPVVIGEDHLHVTVRCAVVPNAATGTSPQATLRRAEVALERCRASGEGVVITTPNDADVPSSSLALERALGDALESRSLVAAFQPIVDLASGDVAGAEALVRLRAADGSLIPPNLFLPIAAELGLMGTITEQMLDHAAHAAAGWAAAGHPIYVAFNAPPTWIRDGALALIGDALRRHRLPAHLLALEVTEEEVLTLSPENLTVLRAIRTLGCHVSIDDFGTGYSGLTAFREIPASLVKIDQSFIATATDSDADRDLLAAIIDLIHRFHKKAVAEGVETVAQLELLRELGCDRVQGFLISPPVPFETMPVGAWADPHVT